MLAVGSKEGIVNIWDLESEERIQTFNEGSKSPLNYISDISFSSDEKILTTGSSKGTMKMWNL